MAHYNVRSSFGVASSILNRYKREQILKTSKIISYNYQALHLSSSLSYETSRQKLLILGTGWSSYAVLKNIDKSKYDVIVVSPRNHFLFTPLLCSTTVGTLEFRSIIEPVRNTKFRDAHHFHLSEAVGIDISSNELHCQSALNPSITYNLGFDKLIIGIGSVSNTFGVPGVKEHAIFLKEVSDARLIRNRVLKNFELAVQPGISRREQERLLHTVIVGGGPTGVEFGAELYDFAKQDLSRLYQQEEQLSHVSLIESNQILGSFDKKLRNFAERKITQRERFHLVKDTVIEIEEDGVVLKSGNVIPCGLIVWSTGLSPRPFIQNLNLPKTERGQLLTNEYLQVLDTKPGTVYAIGDCADIVDYPLPPTAQVAERQGMYLASVLNDKHSGPFKFKSVGMLAYIGGYEGLTDLPEAKLKGFPSWFLWRSAYLTRLGSWRLRMQVPIDWLKTLLYGRDTSQF